MNDEQFYNLMFSELIKEKSPIWGKECVCSQKNEIFIICKHHQNILTKLTDNEGKK